MLEKTIEKKVCDYAKQKGMLVFKFVSPSQRSVCDRIFVCNGTVFFIEFKALGKKPTVKQAKHHKELVENGAIVYVVDNVDDGKNVIDAELLGMSYAKCGVGQC